MCPYWPFADLDFAHCCHLRMCLAKMFSDVIVSTRSQNFYLKIAVSIGNSSFPLIGMQVCQLNTRTEDLDKRLTSPTSCWSSSSIKHPCWWDGWMSTSSRMFFISLNQDFLTSSLQFFPSDHSFWCMDEFGWSNTLLVIGEGKNENVVVSEGNKFLIALKKFRSTYPNCA